MNLWRFRLSSINNFCLSQIFCPKRATCLVAARQRLRDIIGHLYRRKDPNIRKNSVLRHGFYSLVITSHGLWRWKQQVQQTSLCPDLEQQPSYLNNCFTAKLNKFDFVWISLILATKTKNLTITKKQKKTFSVVSFHPVVSTPPFFHSSPGSFSTKRFPFRSTGHQQNDQKGQSKSHQRSKEGNPSYLWCEGFFMWPFGWNRKNNGRNM